MTAKVFRRNFSLLCSNLAIIGRISCNHEYFSGNEGEDLQPRNIFTANKKQYTVTRIVSMTNDTVSGKLNYVTSMITKIHIFEH